MTRRLPIARTKETLKIYPYQAGGFGNSVGSYLAGEAPLSKTTPERTTPRFVEGSGLVVNTVPPNDFGHFEMLNELVQMEPAEALDTELAGQFAAIGIVKGEEFAPDARMRKDSGEGCRGGQCCVTNAWHGSSSNRSLALLR